jgi:hypothetical protein
MGVRARRVGTAPPTGPAQATSIAWTVDSVLAASAAGLGNNEIAYNLGLLDVRADNDLLVTTANGAVASLTSGQGLGGILTQGAAGSQPSHSSADDWLVFAAGSANDTAGGDWLDHQGDIRQRYRDTANALGVFYMLFRLAALPTWQSTLLRVGANSGTYTRRQARGYEVFVTTAGQLRLAREGNTSGTYQQVDAPTVIAANAWYATAVVLADSRASGTVNGASDLASRIFLKSKPGGTHPGMGSASTPAQAIPNDSTLGINIGRATWANFASREGFFNGLRLHSVGFDANPPITDAGIENNLDKLLARVAT